MLTKQDETKQVLRGLSEDQMNDIRRDLNEIESFSGHENVSMNVEKRAVMANDVSQKMKEIFDILKLDYKNDPNLKDTPMRISSMWVNELLIGRYQNEPRMESFPLQFGTDEGILVDDTEFDPGMLICKKVDVDSMCSHHFMPFMDLDANAYAIIAYKPSSKLLGISKLQRIVNWYGRRPQLQEQLTYQIYKHVCDTIGSKDVMVSFHNITHTCESIRGVESECGRTSTMQFGGCFEDSSLRREMISQAK
jgi:GTP cyclohydrolase I